MRPRALVPVALLGACATAQPVPDPTVATIGGKGAVVDTIDARNVHDETAGARFEIPPGPHTIEVSLPAEPSSPPKSEEVKVIPVCFSALAGHNYLTRPVFEQNRWRPEIVDEDSGAIVLAKCVAPLDPDAPPATVGSPPVETGAAPISLPVTSRPASPTANLPGTGLDVGLGFFVGGSSLYDVMFTNAPDRSLSAGRGVLISVGGRWTPLWIEDRVGFGVGAALGWKYDAISASNGAVSLTRFPLDLGAHGLFRLNARWFALAGGGLTRELGGHVSGDGSLSADSDVDSHWGLAAQAGLYYRVERVAIGGGLRYSHLRGRFQGNEIDASSVGIMGSGQYGF
jgi:hypothetical protein